jgi:tyrosyl-tRNA synthetase
MEIVSQFHGKDAAVAAEAEFTGVFREHELPTDVPEYAINFNGNVTEVDIVELIHSAHLAPSRAEARRLIQQGAVELNGLKVTTVRSPLAPGDILRVGKHKFVRIVDKDGN